MTNYKTHKETMAYFEANKYFGIGKEFIHFFPQPMNPGIDFNGNFMMESKSSIVLTPNGNGGFLSCFINEGDPTYASMVANDVQYLNIMGVDNILAKLMDPLFVGYTIEKGLSCGIKVAEKTIPSESVGVFAKINSKIDMIEYVDLTKEEANSTKKDGKLTYGLANILNFMVGVSDLKELCQKYQKEIFKIYHRQNKKIPYVNNEGNLIKPTTANGFTFEIYINSITKYLSRPVGFIMVKREHEFSPIKNGMTSDVDSPISAQKDLARLHKSWALDANMKLIGDGLFEIDSELSYDGEGLESLKGTLIHLPYYLTKN